MKKWIAWILALALLCSGMAFAEREKITMDPEMAELLNAFNDRRKKEMAEQQAAAAIGSQSPEEDIRRVQELLCALGRLEFISGKYDADTIAAVARFQEEMNAQGESLSVNGMADVQTVELLEKQAEAAKLQVVSFNDAALEAIIRQQLGKDTGDIIAEELQVITSLDLSDSDVQDISALRYMPNLDTLAIRGVPVSDISVLEYLPNLKRLYAEDMPHLDFSALEGKEGLIIYK